MTADQGRVSVRHPLLAGALPTAGGRGPRGSSVGTIILRGHDRTRQGSVRVTANATASLSFWSESLILFQPLSVPQIMTDGLKKSLVPPDVKIIMRD